MIDELYLKPMDPLGIESIIGFLICLQLFKNLLLSSVKILDQNLVEIISNHILTDLSLNSSTYFYVHFSGIFYN